ncbi:MAG TPA: hypothetical protein PLG41_08150 [Leptospiraceae bacterium]|nr:hypothetical protein [Leptospiraceae bacterium]
MRVMFYLILFSLANCFTVFTKNETIIESETLETKNVKEERDVYILTSNLNKDGLYLLLDAYRAKEEKSVNSIKEKYQENKDFKFNEGGGGCAPPIELCAAIIVIASTVAIAELTTMPFRLMSEPQERIRNEILTNQSTKIKVLSTKDVSFVLLDRNPPKEYVFKNDKVFIPMQELELDYFTFKKLPYKVVGADKKKVLLKSELNVSKEAGKNNEIMNIIRKNNQTKKSATCNTTFPHMTKQNVTYEEVLSSANALCREKYRTFTSDFSRGTEEYDACVASIRECYDATRLPE